MQIKQLSILIFVVTMFFAFSANAEKKPFSHNEGIGIYVGEINCYGEHEIKNDFLFEFKSQLKSALEDFESKGKLHTIWSDGQVDENNVADFFDVIKYDTVLQNVHMDAICYGPRFNIADANVKMIKYAEKALGEDYFWDDDKLAARKKMVGKPYRISEKMTTVAKTIGEEYQADYLLFCNLVDADIQLKNSIFNANTPLNEKPKQITVVSFFYLIDTKTGLVYEGYNLSDKTAQILNLLGQYGKNYDAHALLQCMFEVHSKRIVEDICNAGQKILSKGI